MKNTILLFLFLIINSIFNSPKNNAINSYLVVNDLNDNFQTSNELKVETEEKSVLTDLPKNNFNADNLIGLLQDNIAASEYNISWQADRNRYESPNRKNNIRVAYNNSGFSITPRQLNTNEKNWLVDYQILGLGRGSRIEHNANGNFNIEVSENNLQYKFDFFTIEYINNSEGSRQNIYVHEKIPGEGNLNFKMDISTDLEISQLSEASIVFGDNDLIYTDLKVWDNEGNALTSTLQLTDKNQIEIIVDDKNAIYPIVIDPLSLTPDKFYESNQAFCNYGKDISDEGDINGDGYNDLIVGAPEYDNGNTNEGRIFIYHGSATGLSSIATSTIELNIASMQFGYSVSYAGDVNSDGFDDVIVGAPFFSSVETSEGSAYLFMGSASGLSATYSWTFQSDQTSAYFGYEVTGLGDINNDGNSDFAVGAYSFDNGQSNEGRVYVYYGETGVIAPVADWIYEPNVVSAYFGRDLSSAGDINNDGYDDMIVGAYNFTGDLTFEGKAFVFHGSSTGFAISPNWVAEGNEANGYFGFSVNDLGDVNNDGIDDIVIGAYSQNTEDISNAGKVYIYHGSLSGLPAIPTAVISGNIASSNFGYTCNSAGDVNYDGYDDLVVGEPYRTNEFNNEGAVHIYLGSSTGILSNAQYVFYGGQANAHIGEEINHLGDINGDLYQDIAIGCPEYDNPSSDEGTVNIYYGHFDGFGAISNFVQLNQNNAGFGSQIATVHSGIITRIAVSAPYFDNGNVDEGLVNIYQYDPWGLNFIPEATIEGGQDNAHLGLVMAKCTDINSDGSEEFLIAAPDFDNGQIDEGIVYLYDHHGEQLWSYESNQNNAKIGTSLNGLADINADGYHDILIGAPEYDSGISDGGAIILFYGNPTLANIPDDIIYGDQTNSNFGISCSNAGDINNDGWEDIIVGASTYDNGQINEGRLYLFFSSGDGFYSIDPYIYENDQANSNLGNFLCGNLNINNDEYSDILLTAPNFDNGELNEGVVQALIGGTNGLQLFHQFEINQPNAQFGSSLSFIPDVNGDFFDEIVIGNAFYDDGQIDEGGIFIYFSSPSGDYPDSNLTIITNNVANSHYGAFVEVALKLDEENYPALLIGCPDMEDGQVNEGLVFIYFLQNIIPVSVIEDYSLFNSSADPNFGLYTVGNIDVNGDDYEDLIYGFPDFDNGQIDEGKLVIYFGNASGIDNIADQQIERNLADFEFGGRMDKAGDINGDGYDDIIVGNPFFDSPQSNEGVVELYLGGPAGLSTTYHRQYQGNAMNKYFGAMVSMAGDINGDNVDDFVVGCSPGSTQGYFGGQTNEGAIFIVFGSTTSIPITPSQIIESNISEKCLGKFVTCGDVNGDGYSDILANQNAYDVNLYYGSAAGLITTPAWTVTTLINMQFSYIITTSDINGDGKDDIFISARLEDHLTNVDEGAVYGFYGTSTTPSTIPDWKVWGGHDQYTTGYSIEFGVELLGSLDFNGDGFNDLIVSAPKSDLEQIPVCCESLNEGEIRIFLGSAEGLHDNFILLEGKVESAEFGWTLRNLGDINDDGFSDFFTSATGLNKHFSYFIYGYEYNTTLLGDDPLITSQLNADFGKQFESAGDVNGDGYMDFMVSAPNYQTSATDNGKLFIYHGGPGGIHTNPDFTLYDRFLFIKNAKAGGDVNGDGYSDVLIQTPSIDLLGNKIHCYYGSPIGIQMANYSTFYAKAPYSTYVLIRNGGDFNNDGYSDIVVSSPQPSFGYTGKLMVFYGSASGPTPENNIIFQENTQTGFSLSLTVADVNADGFSDIIAGAPESNAIGIDFYTPKVFLYLGSATGIDSIADWTYTAPTGDYYAWAINNLGDVNGDGFSDILMHTPIGMFEEYKADIFYGNAIGLDLTPGWSYIHGMLENDLTGPLAPIGDFDNDGYNDMIAPCVAAKKLYIFSGGENGIAINPNYYIESPLNIFPEGWFGIEDPFKYTRIHIAGDLNSDGYSEIAIAIEDVEDYYDDEYDCDIYFIENDYNKNISLPKIIYQTNQANSQLGYSIADAGDVNGDGYNDMIIGAPFYDGGQTDEGKIFVFYGNNSGISPTPAFSAERNKNNSNFGYSVAKAGDVNGDGYGDIIAGAWKFTNGQSQEGAAFIYYGSSLGISPSPLMIESNQAKANLGVSVSTAGDINGDGFSDLLIGAEKFDNGLIDEGVVYVHYGSISGINPIPNVILDNNKKKSNFGHSISNAGDVNGDGFADILVGSDKFTGGQTQEGKSYVFKGSPSGIITSPYWSYESNQVSAFSGCSVTTLGDVNGDGYSDIAVGAYNFDNSQVDEGSVFGFYGSSSGLAATPSWIVESNKTSAGFGYTISGGGDLNADGYSDLIIGSPFYENGEINEGKIFCYFGSNVGLEKTPGYSFEGNIVSRQLGFSINNRCDLNGDGYADILCGSNLMSLPEVSEGIAEIFYGNGVDNKKNNIVLFNNDGISPVSYSNLAEPDFGFHFYRTDSEGLGKSKAVWEVKQEGIPFSHSIFDQLENSIEFSDQQPVLILASDTGTYLSGFANKEGDINKFRIRQQFDLYSSMDGRLYGPWRYYNSPTLIGPVAYPKNNQEETLVTDSISLIIYPNPVNNFLNIKSINELDSDLVVKIFSINGNLVIDMNQIIKITQNDYMIDCSLLPQGTYILNYITKNNVGSLKFVKM